MTIGVAASTVVPPPFDHQNYVPLLLTRQGERLALRELAATIRSAMTPLFVAHPVPTDPRTGAVKISVEGHLAKLAKDLAKDWGANSAFIDLRWVDVSRPMSNGQPAVAFMVEQANLLGLQLAPVLTPDDDVSYRHAAANAAAAAGTTLCLRLSPDHWHDLGTPVGDGRLLGLLQDTGRPATDVHVVLDFEDQLTASSALALAAIRPAIASIPLALTGHH